MKSMLETDFRIGFGCDTHCGKNTNRPDDSHEARADNIFHQRSDLPLGTVVSN